MAGLPPVVILRTDKGDIELFYPTQVTAYNIATLTRMNQAGIAVCRPGITANLATFHEGKLVPLPEWAAAAGDMAKRLFFIEGVGTPKTLPEDSGKRAQVIGQAEAARTRLLKQLREDFLALVKEWQLAPQGSAVPTAAAVTAPMPVKPAASVDARPPPPTPPPPAPQATSAAPQVAAAPRPPSLPTKAVAQPSNPSPPPPAKVAAAPAVAADPDDREIRCGRCSEMILERNLRMHQIACGRRRGCPHCEMVLDAAALDAHIRDVHELRTCSHKGCDVQLPPSRIAAHVAECDFGPTSCPACAKPVVRRELPAHAASTCEHASVPCINRGCRMSMKRSVLDRHVTSECQYRIQRCKYCECEHPAAEMKSHEPDCGSKSDPCVRCGRNVSRQSMAAHIATCGVPPATVRCGNLGCPQLVPPSQLDAHQRECEFRRTACPLCKQVEAKRDLERHRVTICPKELVACVNASCPEKVERERREAHAERSCEYRLIKCQYCEKPVLAKEIMAHEESCARQLTMCPSCRRKVSAANMMTHQLSCGPPPPAGGSAPAPAGKKPVAAVPAALLGAHRVGHGPLVREKPTAVPQPAGSYTLPPSAGRRNGPEALPQLGSKAPAALGGAPRPLPDPVSAGRRAAAKPHASAGVAVPPARGSASSSQATRTGTALPTAKSPPPVPTGVTASATPAAVVGKATTPTPAGSTTIEPAPRVGGGDPTPNAASKQKPTTVATAAQPSSTPPPLASAPTQPSHQAPPKPKPKARDAREDDENIAMAMFYEEQRQQEREDARIAALLANGTSSRGPAQASSVPLSAGSPHGGQQATRLAGPMPSTDDDAALAARLQREFQQQLQADDEAAAERLRRQYEREGGRGGGTNRYTAHDNHRDADDDFWGGRRGDPSRDDMSSFLRGTTGAPAGGGRGGRATHPLRSDTEIAIELSMREAEEARRRAAGTRATAGRPQETEKQRQERLDAEYARRLAEEDL